MAVFTNQKSWAFRVQPSIFQPQYWYIFATVRMAGYDEHHYLHRDGNVYPSVHDGGRWDTREEAAEFLASQTKLWTAPVETKAATCTCSSIDLFNQGCTCGFLKRA